MAVDIAPSVSVQSGQWTVPTVDTSVSAARSEVAPVDGDTTQRALGPEALQAGVQTSGTSHELRPADLDTVLSGRGVLTDVRV